MSTSLCFGKLQNTKKKTQDYDAKAQQTEEYTVHLLNVAGNVLIFNQDNSNSFMESLLQSTKELRGSAEKEVTDWLLVTDYG